ncbi:hypothetical protein B0H13DRAFT_1907415 [Mycena leptocephala]|nr:hypothetical protein B0H13DRAFT_1907415 [Mycena leptocephala]
MESLIFSIAAWLFPQTYYHSLSHANPFSISLDCIPFKEQRRLSGGCHRSAFRSPMFVLYSRSNLGITITVFPFPPAYSNAVCLATFCPPYIMYSKSKVTFLTRNATTLDPHGSLNEQSASNLTFKLIFGLLIVQALPFSAFLSKSITPPSTAPFNIANPDPMFGIPVSSPASHVSVSTFDYRTSVESSVWTLVFGAQNMFWNEFALIIHEFSRWTLAPVLYLVIGETANWFCDLVQHKTHKTGYTLAQGLHRVATDPVLTPSSRGASKSSLTPMYILRGIILFLAIVSLGEGITTTTIITLHPAFASFGNFRAEIFTWLVSSTACDALLTASLVYSLLARWPHLTEKAVILASSN